MVTPKKGQISGQELENDFGKITLTLWPVFFWETDAQDDYMREYMGSQCFINGDQ